MMGVYRIEDVNGSSAEEAGMTNEEVGALTRLKRQMARQGGSLPNDEETLKRYSESGSRWRRLAPVIMDKLIVKDGKVYSATLGRIKTTGRFGMGLRYDRVFDARAMGTHSEKEWEVLQKVFGGCANCCQPEITKDHVVPLSKGGCDCVANLQPLCSRCNSLKGVGSDDLRYQAKPAWVKEFLEEMAS
jgi:hypothetical protein